MALTHEETNRHVSTINVFPDDILLEIFAFCLPDPYSYGDPQRRMRVWQRLVRVCQRWRRIIYTSPRYLDLHLHCSSQTPFRKDLSLWPEFPLTVEYCIMEDEDDLTAALEQPDRIRRIDLIMTGSEAFEAVKAMNVPFPVLTHLELTGPEENRLKDMLDLSDRFLGGSAPCLQHLYLEAVTLMDLPKLLLSTRDLVSLRLENFLPWGYISPEEIVGGLAGLTRLRTLSIKFTIPYERIRDSSMHPRSCAVLPALTKFEFRGGSKIEYSELDAQAPQFSEFIKLSEFKRARVDFCYPDIKLDRPQGECHQAHYSLIISDPELRRSDMARLLDQLVPMLSNVVHLTIVGKHGRGDDMLPLLRLFPAVEAMDVDRNAAGYIASALEDIAEDMVTEVLPALQLLLLDDDDNKLERFLSLRQLSGRPVTIANTQDEFIERLNARWEKV
ncbi:hypothetical protein EDB83DRAFT_2559592 [Lactarius deliciosus]|nr:hypothetical protein EDB83DRAFT_2559592 [Lactarius deliciosus]